ncbi:methionine--tRNA ligase, partial [Candidatus Pacearchaeota archaeon]|nr:methionine--tRNA ligase [Candidatus Pacearchaeota archaeon]
EHGKKIAQAAEAAGKEPKEFVDHIAPKFEAAWTSLGIKPDRFIRTTDKDHQKLVQDMLEKVNKSGDIYLGEYEGLYCTSCEQYYTENDVCSPQRGAAQQGEQAHSNSESDTDLLCPVHNKPLEHLKELSYFFKLSKYQDFLLKLYKDHPEFVLPKERRNEVISRVKEGLNDLSISRTNFDWGVPVPFDKDHVTYVWFDALFNYYTPTLQKGNKKYWPTDLHVLGKDNTWFHCVYWPAFLKAAGLPLPKTVFNHGFLTFNGQKISKSLGNSISPTTLVEKYGADTIRYFCSRQFPFATGEDGDFSEKALKDRHNNELADKLGNLVSRVSTLIEKYGFENQKQTNLNSEATIKNTEKLLENYELDKALNEIFAYIDLTNAYLQTKKPWATKDKKILGEAANAIKDTAILLSPFIPEAAEKIAKAFHFKLDKAQLNKPLDTKKKIKKAPILFQKL